MTVTTHNGDGVSPFGHPRINALLATPRGITQPHTSFIGSVCQGIHRTPLKNTHTTTPHQGGVACGLTRTKSQTIKKSHTPHHRCGMYDARVHYTVLTQHHRSPTTTNPTPHRECGHHRGHEMTGVSRNVLFQTPNSVPTLTCNR